MARGLQKQQEYQQALSLLGKTLLRRSQRRCELTDEAGELVIYDLEAPRVEPSLDEVLHVSPKVRDWLNGGQINPLEARTLETVIWSEHQAVVRAALTLLDRIDEPWAREAAESVRMMREF